MRRGASFTAFGLFAVALVGACVQPVALGYNDAGAQDAGVDAAAGVCIQNPGFFGTPTDEAGIPRGNRPSPRFPGWQICDGHADLNPGVCSLMAPAGSITSTYLGLDVGDFQGAGTSVSTLLMASVPPGSYPFSIDLGLAMATLHWGGFVSTTTPVELRIYGSAEPCGRDEELATVGPVTNIDGWATYSVTLTAHQMFSNLVLVPSLQNESGGPSPHEAYLVVDNLQSQCH
jgi:hypothetical protein